MRVEVWQDGSWVKNTWRYTDNWIPNSYCADECLILRPKRERVSEVKFTCRSEYDDGDLRVPELQVDFVVDECDEMLTVYTNYCVVCVQLIENLSW